MCVCEIADTGLRQIHDDRALKIYDDRLLGNSLVLSDLKGQIFNKGFPFA